LLLWSSIRTGLTLKLAQNVDELYIYQWGWGGSPAYPPQRKEDINEEDSLSVRI